MGALLSLLFSGDKKPHHIETDCHCACDESSDSSGDAQQTSTKSAAVARDSPT
jgi:hypothetical protein